MADYDSLKDWIYDLQVFGIKLGLSSTEAMLDRLGRPERRFPTIHLAGTNGKGSTAAMMASILKASGRRVGLYTSPHLVNFRERFLINDRMPSKKRLAETMALVRAACDEREPPTFFEFTTALAFEYFAEEKVDIGVIETGMGGRLDATNVLEPLAALISEVAVEHTQHLGPTLKHIAFEKAGVIKPGRPILTSANEPKVLAVIAARAGEMAAPFYRLNADFRARWTARGLSYSGLRWRLGGLKLGLLGRHQSQNAALALAGLEIIEGEGFKVSPQAVQDGLARVRWPGRMQLVSRAPQLIVDGGHNPQALRTLIQALAEVPRRRTIIVLGVMADKDVPTIIKTVAPAADRLIVTRAAYERSAAPEVLAAAANGLGFEPVVAPDLMAAVGQARAEAKDEDLILITGSLFVAGEFLAAAGLTPLFEEG